MLLSGALCTIRSLQAKPEWNGHEVTVLGEPELERHTCKLVSGKQLRLKPNNLVKRTTCSQCDTESSAVLKKCSKCGVSAYCSRKCQLQHWKGGHKQSCCSEEASPVQDSETPLCHVLIADNKYLVSVKVAKTYEKQNVCIGKKVILVPKSVSLSHDCSPLPITMHTCCSFVPFSFCIYRCRRTYVRIHTRICVATCTYIQTCFLID